VVYFTVLLDVRNDKHFTNYCNFYQTENGSTFSCSGLSDSSWNSTAVAKHIAHNKRTLISQNQTNNKTAVNVAYVCF